MQRIIYVIPYTSIIDQNAKVFRGILHDKNVLEHHSGIVFDKEDKDFDSADYKSALAAENMSMVFCLCSGYISVDR